MSFKLIYYYSPNKSALRSLFVDPSPKHFKWETGKYQRFEHWTIYGSDLSRKGFRIPFNHMCCLFFRCQIDLPNDPMELLKGYYFNQSSIKRISQDKIPPAIAIKVKNKSVFVDGFINIAAAIYRGDLKADIYVTSNLKYVENLVLSENPGNFS